jgi:hypothetical protein
MIKDNNGDEQNRSDEEAPIEPESHVQTDNTRNTASGLSVKRLSTTGWNIAPLRAQQGSWQ